MADRSAIEWCDSTFNPWTGCTKVSPACDHCYAESWSKRAGTKVGQWGHGAPRVRTTSANWRKPLAWNKEPFAECGNCGCRFATGGIAMVCAACIAAGRTGLNVSRARRRVFCASLADVFDNEVDPTWRRDLFALIEATPNLDWLLLTKRIGNAQQMIETTNFPAHRAWPWPNVWLGATICNQAEADRDIPKLLQVPARVRFLSIEPMLGPINFRWQPYAHQAAGESYRAYLDRNGSVNHLESLRGVDWIIAGGESGAHARPSHPDWFRALRDQCAAAGVPFLFKQWGNWSLHEIQAGGDIEPPAPMNIAGVRRWNGDMFAEPGPRAVVSEVMCAGSVLAIPAGKKAAGRLLDGREHSEFPG